VLRTLQGDAGYVNGVALTADGKRAVSAYSDRLLGVWELESWRAPRMLLGHIDSVQGVALTADGAGDLRLG
jgi:WD40 repeat protein